VTAITGRLFDVVVVGAGPAGAAAAVGLAAQGFSTAVVSKAGHPGVQGLSSRALAGLTEAGLASAAACASTPVTRWVSWAGERSERGQESLIERASFDAGLEAALEDCGVRWMRGSAQAIAFANEAWGIETHDGVIRGRVVLDARGRFARRSADRGPRLVSWSIMLHSQGAAAPGSAVAALEDGWCWLAVTPGGVQLAQFVGAATRRFSREQLARRVRVAARSMSDLDLPIDRLIGEGTYSARAAVARHSQPSQEPGYLRIGDAAVAMDPLSGNGIHEAVRSARVAVAAINSHLRGEPWSVVARFVDERSRELWRRSVQAAGRFYRQQADWSGAEFWTAAAMSYERAAERAELRVEGRGRFEMRPVLNGARIELRRVWVSPDWPRGVWKVNGRCLEQAPAEQIPFLLRRLAGATLHEV
jgi:flavin-dependent dehydrogenase